MTEENSNLEAIMTPEERQLFELFKSMIGKDFHTKEVVKLWDDYIHDKPIVTGYDEHVSHLGIKRWALANEDMNSLWFSDGFAKTTCWKGVIAPPLFIMAIDDGVAAASWLASFLYGSDGVINTKEYPNFVGGLQGNTEFEFYEPVRPGDTIGHTSRCTDIKWKHGKTYRLLFTTGETNYTNQHGRVVAKCRQGAVYRFKK